MTVVGTAATGASPGSSAPRACAAAAVVGPVGRTAVVDAKNELYLRDMYSRYDVPLPAAWPGPAPTTGFADLADALLARLGIDVPVREVVVAHEVPDVVPLSSVTCRLADRLLGRPVPINVDEQGRLAPFTAVRLLLAGRGRVRVPDAPDTSTSLLVLLDRTGLPHHRGSVEWPAGAAAPLEDAAVGLLFRDPGPEDPGEAPAGVVGVATRTGVQAGRAASALGELLEPASPGTVLVTRHALLDALGTVPGRRPGESVAVANRAGTTAPWRALVSGWARWRDAGRTVVLAEHDPRREVLAVLRIDFGRTAPGLP